MIVQGVIAIALFLIYRKYTKKEKQGTPMPKSRVVRPVAYAMSSAIIGTLVGYTHEDQFP